MRYVTMIDKEVEMSCPENINAYISNLISSGILIDMTGVAKVADALYEEIEKSHRPALESQLSPNTYHKITTHKSFFQITDFGKLFINACIA